MIGMRFSCVNLKFNIFTLDLPKIDYIFALGLTAVTPLYIINYEKRFFCFIRSLKIAKFFRVEG